MLKLQNPWLRVHWLVHLMASVMGRVFYPAEYDRGDVLLAAQAVDDPDIVDILPTIPVPVLLVCGDQDQVVRRHFGDTGEARHSWRNRRPS